MPPFENSDTVWAEYTLYTISTNLFQSPCTVSLKVSEIRISQHSFWTDRKKRAFNSLGINWRCQSRFNKILWNTMLWFSQEDKSVFCRPCYSAEHYCRFSLLCMVSYLKSPVPKVMEFTFLHLILVTYYFISFIKSTSSFEEPEESLTCSLVK